MHRLRKWLARAAAGFKRMRIVHKMAVGYILLVFAPIVLFGFFLYNQFYTDVMNDYAQGKQRLVDQAAGSLEVSLQQIESIYSLYQYNPLVVDFLNGRYLSEVDQVYYYLRDIRPVFSFAYSGNAAIRDILLYKTNPKLLPVIDELEPIESLHDAAISRRLDALRVNEGFWQAADTIGASRLPELTFYKKVYNNGYTKELAVLQATVGDAILADFFQALQAEQNAGVLLVRDGRTVYKSGGLPYSGKQVGELLSRLADSPKPYMSWTGQHVLVNSLALRDLDLSIYLFSPSNAVFADVRAKSMTIGAVMGALLIVLSGIYYVIASLLVRRILRLAKHMRRVDEHNMRPFGDEGYQDEVGLLTGSYNAMIRRIDELLNKVQKAELMKREADYMVLQAQIKPHFLYNTLESIRMLAEVNDDEEVVEATYTFGKLMRYTLSSGENDTPLTDEVDNVRHYLEMHKLRMMDKLHFSIGIDADIAQVRCPRFILQPLVENAIHHGISKVRKPGRIDVQVSADSAFYRISIADNGPGMTDERLALVRGVLGGRLDRSRLQTSDSGHGLYNVSERIKSFFGERSGLQVDSREGEGTSCLLLLQKTR